MVDGTMLAEQVAREKSDKVKRNRTSRIEKWKNGRMEIDDAKR